MRLLPSFLTKPRREPAAEGTYRLHGYKFEVAPFDTDRVICGLLESGQYERREIRLVERVVQPGQSVLELGGGLGVVSTILAGRLDGGRLTTVEADPRLVPVIENNLAINSQTATVLHGAVFPAARMPATDTVEFHIRRLFWASSLVDPADGQNLEVVEVPVLCLEDILSRQRADTLVMDIEGGELELFERGRFDGVDEILCEIHYEVGKERLSRAIYGLAEQGFYADFQLSGGKILRLSRNM